MDPYFSLDENIIRMTRTVNHYNDLLWLNDIDFDRETAKRPRIVRKIDNYESETHLYKTPNFIVVLRRKLIKCDADIVKFAERKITLPIELAREQIVLENLKTILINEENSSPHPTN